MIDLSKLIPTIEKNLGKRSIDYEIKFANGTGIDITLDKGIPGAKLIEGLLDQFLKKDLGTAEVDPDLEKKL